MYLKFYNLAQEPFQITPDPEFIYLSPSHREALASIMYGVQKRKGFVSVVGEVGTGKTTVIRAFLANLDREKVTPVYLFTSQVSVIGLLRAIINELGLKIQSNHGHEIVRELHKILVEYFRRGKNIVLIIDEAQNMPVKTLEVLRMLSNLETNKEKLIQIVLVGQPELLEKLRRPELRQLRQRLVFRSTIQKLTREDSFDYIIHRLDKAGGSAETFSKSALNKIVKAAGGIPRLLNILCDNALIAGYGYQAKSISLKIVKEVIRDLDLEESGRFRIPRLATTLAAAMLLVGLGLFFGSDRLMALYQHTPPTPLGVVDKVSQKVADQVQLKEPSLKEEQVSHPVNTIADARDGGELGQSVAHAAEADKPASSADAVPWPNDVAGSPLGQAWPYPATISQPVLQSAVTTSALGVSGGQSPSHEITTVNSVPTDNNKTVALPIRYAVRMGDSLQSLCKRIYGQDDIRIIIKVKKHNPSIQNINLICVGDVIEFPEIESGAAS